MSIDANVTGYALLPDGTVRLTLEQPDRSRVDGQGSLVALDPPGNFGVLVGRAVWGSDSMLMCGEIMVGRRVGYTACRLSGEALEEVRRTGAGLPR